jgi:hypothetical protein
MPTTSSGAAPGPSSPSRWATSTRRSRGCSSRCSRAPDSRPSTPLLRVGHGRPLRVPETVILRPGAVASVIVTTPCTSALEACLSRTLILGCACPARCHSDTRRHRGLRPRSSAVTRVLTGRSSAARGYPVARTASRRCPGAVPPGRWSASTLRPCPSMVVRLLIGRRRAWARTPWREPTSTNHADTRDGASGSSTGTAHSQRWEAHAIARRFLLPRGTAGRSARPRGSRAAVSVRRRHRPPPRSPDRHRCQQVSAVR